MLAAEVVVSAPSVCRELVAAVRTTVDVMRRLPVRITHPVRKGGKGPARCICVDQDYLDVYRTQYSTA